LKEAKSKTKTKKKGQMVDAEERWNKRCLTDEFLFVVVLMVQDAK
jgi:hypothetical protein